MATVDTLPRAGFWKRAHYLNRMTLHDLVTAYFQHPAIIGYLLLTPVFVAIAAAFPTTPVRFVGAIAAAMLLYPLSWYVIHRFILHGGWMHKHPITARIWQRTHYSHHQDPNHLEVLFGSLGSTLPTVAVTTAISGYLIGGVGGAAAAFAFGLLLTCVYEFFHCIQHLGFKPKAAWLVELKRRHMEHHFHDEDGNYGIISFFPDKFGGTLYDRRDRPNRSATVFNLGYTQAVAARYPWVADMSGGLAPDGPRRPAGQ